MEPEQALPLESPATGGVEVATESAPASAPSVTTEAPSAAESPATETDWKTRIADLDPDELYALHPKLKNDLDGKAGRLAQQQAERLRQSIEAEANARAYQTLQAQQQQAEFERLAKEDPFAFAERYQQSTQQSQAQRQQQQALTQAAMAHAAAVDQAVLFPMAQKLPEADQRELAQRLQGNYYAQQAQTQYGVDWNKARSLYADDVLERYAEHKSSTKLSEVHKTFEKERKELAELRAARAAEGLGVEAEAAGSPDLGGGSAGGTGGLTPQRWNAATSEQREEWKQNNPGAVEAMWAAMRRG